ncbi:MAG: DUF362 domain-containing protein [Syntrophaceae bacterium]|nr:DUF362 domain-containing protein [Syntrophaceae bacterium]
MRYRDWQTPFAAALETIRSSRITRRELVFRLLPRGLITLLSLPLFQACIRTESASEAFIAKVPHYGADIRSAILSGFRELGVGSGEIKGKTILLKPNLVETRADAPHINTHPMVIRAAADAFRSLGASHVLVGEGSGHCRDTLRLLEESGMADVLVAERIPFVDLNYDDVYTVPNAGGRSRLNTLTLPLTLRKADWVVSMAKLKTHHWAGVTLSMKNLFGLMPGSFYGWPKNILHHAGIENCIFDINATVKPHFAIVDGIVGMEGDGPIMGTPKAAGVIVMGRNFPAVDATCSRVMGIDPGRVDYLADSSGRLGAIREENIRQRGEPIDSVSSDFDLLQKIPAHRGLRLRR